MKKIDQMVQSFCDSGFQHEGWRTEDKFLCPPIFKIHAVDSLFSPERHFVIQYPARKVNSIYFDSIDNERLRQSIDGDPFKMKIRFRWYGESLSPEMGSLEVKLKQGSSGIKLRSQKMHYSEAVYELSSKTSSLFYLSEKLLPTVLVTYRRSYYRSLVEDLRLTVDEDLAADHRVMGSQNVSLIPLTEGAILEVKKPITSTSQREMSLSSFQLPLRKIKLSKYDQACRILGL